MNEKEKPPDAEGSPAKSPPIAEDGKQVNFPLKNAFDIALERARTIRKKYAEENTTEKEEE